MGIYEFDQEVYDQVLCEDGERIGIEKGIEKGKEIIFRIYKEIRKGESDNEAIAKICGCTAEEVEEARREFEV